MSAPTKDRNHQASEGQLRYQYPEDATAESGKVGYGAPNPLERFSDEKYAGIGSKKDVNAFTPGGKQADLEAAEHQRFQEQCFLMETFMVHGRAALGRAYPKHYRQISYRLPAAQVNKLFIPRGVTSAFMKMSPLEAACLLPKIRLFKQIHDDQQNLVATPEYIFDTHLTKKSIKGITEGRHRGLGAGIKSFNFKSNSTNFANQNVVTAKAVFVFQSMQALMDIRKLYKDGSVLKTSQHTRGADGKISENPEMVEQTISFLDFITYGNVGTKKADKNIEEPPEEVRRGEKDGEESAEPTKLDAWMTSKYEKRQFSLKALVGWTLDEKAFGDLRSNKGQGLRHDKPGGSSYQSIKQLAKTVKNSNLVMMLQLYQHNIKYKQDGSIELECEFQGGIEGSMENPALDLFRLDTRKRDTIKEEYNNKVAQAKATIEDWERNHMHRCYYLDSYGGACREDAKEAAIEHGHSYEVSHECWYRCTEAKKAQAVLDNIDQDTIDSEQANKYTQLIDLLFRGKLSGTRDGPGTELSKIYYWDNLLHYVDVDAKYVWMNHKDLAHDAIGQRHKQRRRNIQKGADSNLRPGAGFNTAVKYADPSGPVGRTQRRRLTEEGGTLDTLNDQIRVQAATGADNKLKKRQKIDLALQPGIIKADDSFTATSMDVTENSKVRIFYFHFGSIFDAALELMGGDEKTRLEMNYILGTVVLKEFWKKEVSYQRMELADLPISSNLFLQKWVEFSAKNGKASLSLRSFVTDFLMDLLNTGLGKHCYNPKEDSLADQSQRLTPQVTTFSLPLRDETDGLPWFPSKVTLDKSSPMLEKYIAAENLTTREIGGYLRANAGEGHLKAFGKITPSDFRDFERADPLKKIETAKKLANYWYVHFPVSVVMTRKADKAIDEAEGIPHFSIGSHVGIVKNMEFKRTDNKYVRSFRIKQNAGAGARGAIDVYNCDLTLVGAPWFLPGQHAYISPDSVNFGDPSKKYSLARQIGLGGYFNITEAESIIESGKFETLLKCWWQSFGDGEGGEILKEGEKVKASQEEDSPEVYHRDLSKPPGMSV